MSVREPVVAGTFYPRERSELLRKLTGLFAQQGEKRKVLAALVPHAGYDYSGAVAAAVLSQIDIGREVILLSFHHRGHSSPIALWSEGAWRTPIGSVEIAESVVDRIRTECPGAEVDESAFLHEHSAEVQIPLLKFLNPEVRIAPVSLNTTDRHGLEGFGAALARVAGSAFVLATTDFTHCGEGYGVDPPLGKTPRDWANEQDALVLARIGALDLEGFWRVVHERGVTMCGVAPTVAMIAYARARGATRAEVIRYATSADDEPEALRAVGYGGILVPRSQCPVPS